MPKTRRLWWNRVLKVRARREELGSWKPFLSRKKEKSFQTFQKKDRGAFAVLRHLCAFGALCAATFKAATNKKEEHPRLRRASPGVRAPLALPATPFKGGLSFFARWPSMGQGATKSRRCNHLATRMLYNYFPCRIQPGVLKSACKSFLLHVPLPDACRAAPRSPFEGGGAERRGMLPTAIARTYTDSTGIST